MNFVRALKRDLYGKKGTIFRYHNHENTYLIHFSDNYFGARGTRP